MIEYMYRFIGKVFLFAGSVSMRITTKMMSVSDWFFIKAYVYSDESKSIKFISAALDKDSYGDMEKYTTIKKGGCEVQTGVFRRTDCE
ncbi:hypothetical protein LCGC14_1981280 [marine sediment metagenome]|uniref:Uncharacterized protein n=1 Tax=marine sediment metagenome TaxID=412755 RepID=A0A0F9I5W5_9ZZZZ